LTDQNIELILKILQDGQWHGISELAEKTSIPSPKIQLVTDFLAKYTFIELDPKNRKIKLSRRLVKFFQKTSLKTKNVC